MHTLIAITIIILATALADAKEKHLPQKIKKFNKKKTFPSEMDDRRAFRISDTQNTLYKEWRATTDEQEYLIKKKKFLNF